MKNVFLFLLCFMLHTVVFAQISESDLVGKRFEICHDNGGLEGCTKTATLIFTDNITGKMAINTNGLFHFEGSVKDHFYSGEFIFEIFGGKYISITPIPGTFLDSVIMKDYPTKTKETLTQQERGALIATQFNIQMFTSRVFEIEKTSQDNYILKQRKLSAKKENLKKEFSKLEMKKF